jgi:riboflavin biosynthesis pyrimidine reductase
MAPGGVTFPQSLVALDVVDEYRMLVCPYVAGSGLALFGEVQRLRGSRSVSAPRCSSGVMALVYRPARSN